MTRYLAVIGAGIVALASLVAGEAIALRNAALAERALAEAGAQPPMVRLKAGDGVVARDDREAAAVLAALIADRAAATGIPLSARMAIGAVPPGFAAVDIDARGREESLRALARAVEGDRPVVRLVRWSIRPAAGALLRLEGRAVAPVQTR